MKLVCRTVGKTFQYYALWCNRHPDSNGLYDMDHWLDPVTSWFQIRGMT